jgi:hypothetical protein
MVASNVVPPTGPPPATTQGSGAGLPSHGEILVPLADEATTTAQRSEDKKVVSIKQSIQRCSPAPSAALEQPAQLLTFSM